MRLRKINRYYQILKKTPSSKLRLVFLYRYISLVLTSAFFLLGPQSPFIFKVGVILTLGLAAWLVSDLQRKYLGNNKILKLIVVTETIGLTLLLIPTGGISSPFIWYALNPVLVAASFLTPLFCWGVLTFYLSSATFIAYSLFRKDNLVMIFEEHSYIYLVCLLITLLARLFSGLTKELDSKASLLNAQQQEMLLVNEKLTKTNQNYQDTLEHIMSLYRLMDNFSSNKSPERLTKEIMSSLRNCTQTNETFFWLTNRKAQVSYLENTTNIDELEANLNKDWNQISKERDSFIQTFHNEKYWMKTIITSTYDGVLGMKVSSLSEGNHTFLLKRTFEFLAELSEIMLERIRMDYMMDQMIVIEEQNRIANEIHDSVSQRLFGMVYSLHSLKVKSLTSTTDELNQEYQFLSQTANTTMKELRAAIYRLSSVKKGDHPFFTLIKKYLEEYAKLNEITIDYQLTGEEHLLSYQMKNTLYRIICEACGNAVRHGKCKIIKMKLSILDENIVLDVRDDGIGINSGLDEGKKEAGIGLYNMKNSVKSYGGSFSIKGIQDVGTELEINIPNMLKKSEAVG